VTAVAVIAEHSLRGLLALMWKSEICTNGSDKVSNY